VFALLAVEELGENGVAAPAISAITLTVLLSVVLHGTSAGPLVVRYAHGESTKDAAASSPRSRRAAHT
jgi:NhaP-type Na+/H+ or K+/H+ antiporter